MLVEFIYENHLGQRFYGKENGVFLNSSDLLDYKWRYDTINNRISRFYTSITDRKLPLRVRCKYEIEATRVKNLLHEIAEIDVEAEIPGKIFVGDYYTIGYITSSSKSEYLKKERYCNITLTLTSEDPKWYREETTSFDPAQFDAVGSGKGTDYPYDYPYDYAISSFGQSIVCDSIRSSAFKLRIYGGAVNPTIMIGGHVYAINGSVGAGESLLIDSIAKTITLTTATGLKVNWFDKRSRDSYIFAPIPAGENDIIWNGSFAFDLTVIEKRSEPKWT